MALAICIYETNKHYGFVLVPEYGALGVAEALHATGRISKTKVLYYQTPYSQLQHSPFPQKLENIKKNLHTAKSLEDVEKLLQRYLNTSPVSSDQNNKSSS